MIESKMIANTGGIAIGAICITSIPHLSILCNDGHWQDANERITLQYKEDMRGLLYELYQYYRMRTIEYKANQMDAYELLWVTKPVDNQPYKANISLYIIIRSLQPTTNQAEDTVKAMLEICQKNLHLDRYTYELCNPDVVRSNLASVDLTSPKAIVKTERIDAINTTVLQACYSYDTFMPTNVDMGRIVNILIQNPGCGLSVQLMPSYFTPEEINELSNKSQMLSMLVNGVSVQGVGNIQIELAKRPLNTYNYYHTHSDQPLFNFNLVIYAPHNASAQIAAKQMGQLNAGQPMSTAMDVVGISGFHAINNFDLAPWLIHDFLEKNARNAAVWNSGYAPPTMHRLLFLITGTEACELFRLPIGNTDIGAGLIVNETGISSKTYSQNLINAGDIEVGKLKSLSANSIGFTLKDLAKHMLIVGTPGSGKTTFSVGLLDRLWKDHHIPFLVIEPAKNEYRALVQSIPELQVFTPGKNFISPFVFNPFVPPKNVRLETYKSTLKTAFAAGVSMSSPLDKIFEDTINNCYSDFRWLDSYTIDDKGKVFNISDFIKCFQETFDEIGYTGDAKNIGRAGIVRLKSLVNLFDNYFSIPIEDLLTKPTIIELAAIENSDQKALIIALLLLSILAYVNANYVGEGGLRNFILLEEAHVLLDSSSNGGEGAANPAAIAQGLVKRMLAEIRSYGVGLAIADQSPRKVGIDIVALTDIKVAFRLVEGQDKEILADSTSMTDTQLTRLAKLKPGEAFLFFNRLEEPEEIITPDYRLNNQISISLSDEGIRELSTYWNDKQEELRPYPECKCVPYCQHSCNYGRRILAREVARRIFKNHIGTGCKDPEKLKAVLRNISNYIKEELNDEPFTRELLSCVKVYLWRHVKYDTKLNVAATIITSSLTKE